MLKVLEVLDRAFVSRVTGGFGATENFLVYFCFVPLIGIFVCQAGASVRPLILVGLIIFVVSPCIPLLAYALELVIKFVHRKRTFCGNQFSAVLYWLITEVLEDRGITNTKKYLRGHPDHSNALIQTIADMDNIEMDEWHEIVALVYHRDDNPEATGKAILSIVEEQGETSASGVKELLKIREETANALLDGVL